MPLTFPLNNRKLELIDKSDKFENEDVRVDPYNLPRKLPEKDPVVK